MVGNFIGSPRKEVIMSRKSFVLYTEWEDAFDGQPNDVAGELIKSIFDYVRTEEIPRINNGVASAMFSILKPAIDRNIGKYDAAIEQRREAAKKSVEKRKLQQSNKDKQSSTTVSDRKRTSTDSVSDSVSTEVDDKEKIVKEKSLSLSDRNLKFKEELTPFVEKYGKDMIWAFFDYWSEPDKAKTKMRYEMQKTWNIAGRLRTWERRLNEKR